MAVSGSVLPQGVSRKFWVEPFTHDSFCPDLKCVAQVYIIALSQLAPENKAISDDDKKQKATECNAGTEELTPHVFLWLHG